LDLSDSPLAIAAIGVLGTLLASTLSPLISERSKRKEFDRTRAERLEQAEREEARARRLELRQTYITFNTAARDYHRALRAWSYAADNNTDRAAESVDLPQTRQTFQTAYAEAQMIVSAPVLELAQQVATKLADAYSILKHREDGTHDPATDTTAEARRILGEAWEPLRTIRIAMRSDLDLPTH
jgi:type II secretory pathway pseudopilin PulG